MNARVASARIALGIPSVMATMIGLIPLGSRWRMTIRVSDTPIARAASTNSVSLSASSWPRTSRATVTHDVRPMATNTRNRPSSAWPKAVSRNATDSRMMNSRSGNA